MKKFCEIHSSILKKCSQIQFAIRGFDFLSFVCLFFLFPVKF